MTERVLYLVLCPASLASRIDSMVKFVHNEGWSVYCLHPIQGGRRCCKRSRTARTDAEHDKLLRLVVAHHRQGGHLAVNALQGP